MVGKLTKKRAVPMPLLPPAPDKHLVAMVLASIVVLTMTAATEAPAGATTISDGSASRVTQDERFQPHHERALPPFGARTILAPADTQKRQRLPGAEATR